MSARSQFSEHATVRTEGVRERRTLVEVWGVSHRKRRKCGLGGHLNTSMVLRRLLLPRVLVVTALKPVPWVNVVRHAAPGDIGPAVLRRLLLRIVDGHPAGGVVDRGVAVSPGRGASRLQVVHPFLIHASIHTRKSRLSRIGFEFYCYMYIYAHFKDFPHLLMTKSPSRVVLRDVGALVSVSGRHLRVRARPAPRKHLKEDETMVQKCELHSW